eukprot:s863_g5.t1
MIPPLRPGLTYTQAAGGTHHTALLQSDGNGNWKQQERKCSIPVLERGPAYTHVSAGDQHTILVPNDGVEAEYVKFTNTVKLAKSVAPRSWPSRSGSSNVRAEKTSVALGDLCLRFVWQAWRLVTSAFTLCGRRGTYGTGLGLVTAVTPRLFCVAGDIFLRFVQKAWRGAHGTGLALVAALVAAGRLWRRASFAWQAWHLHLPSFCVVGVALGDITGLALVTALVAAGVALGDISLRFVWQAWHSRHGGGLGRRWSPVAPWFCVAARGVALTALFVDGPWQSLEPRGRTRFRSRDYDEQTAEAERQKKKMRLLRGGCLRLNVFDVFAEVATSIDPVLTQRGKKQNCGRQVVLQCCCDVGWTHSRVCFRCIVASSAAYVGTSQAVIASFSLCPCVLSVAEVQKSSACVSNVTEMFERSDACFACVAFLAVERHLPACLPASLSMVKCCRQVLFRGSPTLPSRRPPRREWLQLQWMELIA